MENEELKFRKQVAIKCGLNAGLNNHRFRFRFNESNEISDYYTVVATVDPED